MKGPEPATLDTRPSRQFTSREAATILGAAIGGLVQTAGKANARTALRWWFENWDASTREMPDRHGSADAEIVLVNFSEESPMGWRNESLEALDRLEAATSRLRNELEAPERRQVRPSPQLVAWLAAMAALEAFESSGPALEQDGELLRELGAVLGDAFMKTKKFVHVLEQRVGGVGKPKGSA